MSVKPRFDEKGTEFGLIHRLLPGSCCMTDIDSMVIEAHTKVRVKTADNTFVEYEHVKDDVKIKAILEVKYRTTDNTLKALDVNESTTKIRQKIAKLTKARHIVIFATEGRPPFKFYEIQKNGAVKYLGELNYKTETEQKPSILNFWQKIGLLVKNEFGNIKNIKQMELI